MDTDKTTLADLSIFSGEEEFSVFNKLNLTRTLLGREQLRLNFTHALQSVEEIRGVQQTIRLIGLRRKYWPTLISNGTLMVIERFYDTSIDQIPARAGSMAAMNYKIFHSSDFSLVKYSVTHCFEFIKGMQLLIKEFLTENAPAPLKKTLEESKHSIAREQFAVIEKYKTPGELNNKEMLQLAHFIRYHYKQHMYDLLDSYAQIDAWWAMAEAMEQYGLVFPEFIEGDQPVVSCKGLYHVLLARPVAYDVDLDPKNNFLFLTGANMAGKSTFIKSVGIGVFLAHTGMGVPAQKMQLTFFDGLLSNINVVDNVVKGESYFYNEVQRIKTTVTRINNGKKWLILIDELFKGTNVQDAMKCSSTVIEGLLKIKNSLFILSTHLYEIGEELKKYSNISFRYFETTVTGEQLEFSYQLKEGISNDRLGYLILKKEGVVELLSKL